MDLVVVGSVGLDDVETPFGKVERALGGSAIYFSLSSVFFSAPGFVGVVGTDFPEEGLDTMRSRGVDLRGLAVMEGETFRWGGKYGYDLNERDTLYTHLNVFEQFRPELPEDYRSAPYLFLGNIDPELQLAVLDQATGAKFVAMDTMNFWIEGKREALGAVLSRVDALFINDSEVRELAEDSNVVSATQKVAAMGPSLVVVKRGEYGALLFHHEQFFYAPAYPLENVVDPTGAGDCFAGGFMGYVANARDTSWRTLCQATIAGSTIASFSVESFSVDQLLTLSGADIGRRAAQFRTMTDFHPLPPLA